MNLPRSLIKEIVIISTLFGLLSVLMLFPASLQLSDAPIGDGDDAWTFTWTFWWMEQVALDDRSLFFTHFLNYPNGADLRLNTLSPLNAILSLAVQLFTDNLMLVYNLLLLFSFVATGVGTYFLMKYLFGNPWAAFLAGAVFTFAPYRMGHALGHLNLVSTQWIPFILLFLIKALDERSYRYAALAGVSFSFLVLSSYIYGVYMALFIALLAGFLLVKDRDSLPELKRYISYLAVVGIVASLLVLPILYPTVEAALQEDVQQEIEYEARPGLYTHMTVYHTLSTIVPQLEAGDYTSNANQSIFIGYVVLAFAALSLLTSYRWKWFWIGSAAFFAILSLGRAGGIYTWFHSVPLVGTLRNPVRFSLLTILSLLPPFVNGLTLTWERVSSYVSARGFYSLVLVLILLEFAWIPYPAVDEVPDGTEDTLHATIGGDSPAAVLNIPLGYDANEYPATYMYLQTVHEHPQVSGIVSRELVPTTTLNRSDFLQTLRERHYSFNRTTLETARTELAEKHVKWVVVHRYFLDREFPEQRFNEVFNRTLKTDDLIIYRTY